MTFEEENALEQLLDAVNNLTVKLGETNERLNVQQRTINDIKSLQAQDKANKDRRKRSKRLMTVFVIAVVIAFVFQQVRSNDQVGCLVSWGHDVTSRSQSLSSPAVVRVNEIWVALGGTLKQAKLTPKDRELFLKDINAHRKVYPGLPSESVLEKSTDPEIINYEAVVQGQDANDEYISNTKSHPIPILDCPFWSFS